ncbi:MAG: hypothetical protein IPL79_00185 [Myxococcales bacterium]|nr:hypothetical protein [Myxococcales bacterium]
MLSQRGRSPIFSLLAGIALAASAPFAAASPLLKTPSPDGRPMPARAWVDPSMVQMSSPQAFAAGGTGSRLIYLNNCNVPDSCLVTYGPEDSRTNHSAIIDVDQGELSPFPYSATVWNDFVQCVRETLLPFDVEVTESDPGNVPHWENMVAGHPNDMGMSSDIAGVSPWSGGCAVLNNTITFTYAENHNESAYQLCWTAVQEVAHSWGLDHEMLVKSPMTYLSGQLPKRFQNVDAFCGEDQNRPCECGPSKQNSWEYLMNLFGPSTPIPPTVSISVPPDGARVAQGFAVKAIYNDDVGVEKAELYIDGVLISTGTSEPFVFNAPTDLAPGMHQVVVRAYDVQDAVGISAPVNVEIGPPCVRPSECGAGNTCFLGECVPGPDTPGGMGAPCSENEQCFDAWCASNGTIGVCSSECDIAAANCPSGFDCVQAGDAGACWPSSDSGCQGSTPDNVPLLPCLLAMVVSWVIVRRRHA